MARRAGDEEEIGRFMGVRAQGRFAGDELKLGLIISLLCVLIHAIHL